MVVEGRPRSLSGGPPVMGWLQSPLLVILPLTLIRMPLAQEALLPMALLVQSLLMVSSCGHHVLELKQAGADPGGPKGELLCRSLASLSRIL